jgi:hypothetical protein
MVRGAHCRQHRQVAGSTTEGIVRAVRCSKGPEIEGGTNGSGTSHAVKTDCCSLWGWRRGLLRVYAPSVNDAQFPVGQQEAGRHAVSRNSRSNRWCGGASQPSSTPRCSGSTPRPSTRTRICYLLSGSATAQCGIRSVLLSSTRTDRSAGSGGPPETPATCVARQPRICVSVADLERVAEGRGAGPGDKTPLATSRS